MSEIEAQAAHSAKQAMQPGWWAYAQQSVARLEAMSCGTYTSLRVRVGEIVKASSYRPSAHEREVAA